MYLCRGKDTEANEWENVEIKGNGPLIIYRRGKWLEVFKCGEGEGEGEVITLFSGERGV